MHKFVNKRNKTHLGYHFSLSFSALLVGDTSETNTIQQNSFRSVSKQNYLDKWRKKQQQNFFLIN